MSHHVNDVRRPETHTVFVWERFIGLLLANCHPNDFPTHRHQQGGAEEDKQSIISHVISFTSVDSWPHRNCDFRKDRFFMK